MMLPLTLAFNDTHRMVRMFSTLSIALGVGFLARRMDVPLPWLLGSMIASSVLTISGFDLGMPDWIRRLGQAMAGFSVGLYFTPQVAYRVLDLGVFMVATGLLSILASVFLSLLLAKLGGCERKTAYFATLPGGLAEMAGMAGQFGGNVTLVSLSQALRVVLIVIILPPLLSLLSDGQDGAAAAHQQLALYLTVLGLLLAIAVSMTFQRLRLFNAWLLGGLAAGMIFGLLLKEHAYAPSIVPSIAQIFIGSVLGGRFKRQTIRDAGLRFIPSTILSTLLLMAFNAVLAFTIAGFVGIGTGILATAPGGIAEMSLTAELLKLSPPIVTAWQLARIILVATIAGPLFRVYQRYFFERSE